MKTFYITGMSCAACSARVEKAVSKVIGVESCSVNLLTNTMTVDGTASDNSIIKAVENAGYGAKAKDKSKNKVRDKDFEDDETPRLLKRLILSALLVLVLMYLSMGYTMWGLPLPKFFEGNPLAIAIVQMLLSICVMIINRRFFINGVNGLIHKAPNMDTLVSLGSGASFVYSTIIVFAMTRSVSSGNDAAHYLHNLYFESAAMILALITLGKMLESKSKGKTTNAIKELLELSPKTALILENGEEKEISISMLKKGDSFIVKAGMSIPTDAQLLSGHISVDEAALTGESLPVDKEEGSHISAGTICKSGYAQCIAERVGEDTTLAQIIRMVTDASATKAPISKIADRVSGVFVPAVIIISIITTIIWLFSGQAVGYALSRGISVLVISCPCALGLATPVAIMVGSGKGARSGILFKTATALEETGRIKKIALDKTGTITKGKPYVTGIVTADGISEEQLLCYAYALEKQSEHPLSLAINEYARSKNTPIYECTGFETLSGIGVKGVIDGRDVFGGNISLAQTYRAVDDDLKIKAEQAAISGETPLFFGDKDTIFGFITVADTIKEDSPNAIKELKDMGIEVIMLTGDNKNTALSIKKKTNIDKVIAEVLPAHKEAEINKLKTEGKTAMVGDGINDAPALTAADVGIAIGSGTDIAIESADVVLMNNTLSDVAAAIRLSRHTLRNIHQNLFWAFIYNIIGIPLAAGVFIPATGWELNPMFGAAAMSLSSFCVVTNALRLNFVNIHSPKIKSNIKEQKHMEMVMNIEGMMCVHCEARVKKTLEAIDGVTEAIVDHTQSKAIVRTNKEVALEILKKAVEEAGYTVK